MIIIGLTGLATAGKTTVADLLVEHHGFEKFAFAKPLRDALAVLGIIKEEDPEFFRFVAQRLGTDTIRTKRPDFWVDHALSSIEGWAEGCEDLGYDRSELRVVVDDVRFPNEISALQQRGAHIIHVYGGKRVGRDENEMGHESEKMAWFRDLAIEKSDVPLDFSWLDNSKLLDDLPRLVDSMWEKIKELEAAESLSE